MNRDRRADPHLPSSHRAASHEPEPARQDDMTSGRRRRRRLGEKLQRTLGIRQAEAREQIRELQAIY